MIVVVAMMQIGLITVTVFWFGVQVLQKIPLTLDMSQFYVPQWRPAGSLSLGGGVRRSGSVAIDFLLQSWSLLLHRKTPAWSSKQPGSVSEPASASCWI